MELTINGKTYTLQAVNQKFLSEMVTWAAKQLPDPLESIKDKLAWFDKDLQREMIKEAMAVARTPKTLASPDIQAIFATPAGIEYQLRLLFNQPELKAEELWNLHLSAVREHGPNYLENILA